MNEFRASDSLDLFAKRWVLIHMSSVNNIVGQLLTFIESITPDGEQQEARKQITRRIIYSITNGMLEVHRDSIDDLRKFLGYLDGESEYDWDVISRED